MGNCATKPKVLKDTDEDQIPVERDTTAPTDHNKHPAEKGVNNAPNASDEAAAEAAATRRSEKGKDILIEDDVEEHSKRQSLSHLFHEDKAIEKEITDLSPTKPDSHNKSGASSDVLKLDTCAPMASHVKAPETFDVQTRNDLEVKIPKDSKVKSPETPKAKEAAEEEDNFSENWEVKFPEELEATKTSEVVKVAEESKLPQVSKVSAPELSEVKVTKELDVPKVLEDKDKSVPEVSEVPAPPELSEIKVTKELDVPEVLEDKNVLEVSKVMTDEVKAAESEILKVSEVKSSEDLDIKVPKVFEAKTPETSSVKVGLEDKTDQEATKVKTAQETEVSEFVDAQEKIDKSEAQILEDIKVTEDKEIAMPQTVEGEKELSFDKKVKKSILSDLDNK